MLFNAQISDKVTLLTLKREQERRRCAEGYQGFIRFLQKYCYIQDKIEKRPSLFRLWPAQLRILPEIFSAMLLIVLKARQLGLTWLCAAYCLWVVCFHPMKLIVVISAKGDWAVEFLDRVYFILARLPDWMLPKVLKDTSEVFRVHHKEGNSEIKSLTTTEAGAQSKTPDILILDETCWNPYVREIYNASLPGIESAGGRIIVISNSIKAAPGWGWTKEIFVNSMKGVNGFKRIFMSWMDRPGRPENFRAIQIEAGMDPEDVIEHYPESESEAIAALSGSYFGNTLNKHEASCRPGSKGEIRRDRFGDIVFEVESKGIIELWRYPYYLLEDWDGHYWERRYAIGSDVSEGLGQSYSVGYVMDRHFDELVCRVRSNRLDAVQWADILDLLARWYNNANNHAKTDGAVICAERTGAGQTTVKELLKKGANQYVRLVPGKVGSPVTKELGWHESEQAKHELCGDLKHWFRTTTGGFYDALLLEECSHTIKHEGTQRIGPEDDTKLWDCVVAAGCTIQASHFLGEPAKRLEVPVTGWLKRLTDKRSGSPWAV